MIYLRYDATFNSVRMTFKASMEIVKREAIGGSTCLPLTHLPLPGSWACRVSGPSWPSPGGSLGSGGGALQRWVRQHRWAEWENDPGEVPKVRSSRPYRRVKPGVDTIPSTEAPRRVVTGAYLAGNGWGWVWSEGGTACCASRPVGPTTCPPLAG
jgi:hypothetical protein